MSFPRSPQLRAAMKAAGISLDPPASPLLPAGELIVEFTVPARPVPWSVPMVLRTGVSIKENRLVAWQAEVKLCAALAMRGRRPYDGPVEVVMQFHLTRIGGPPPDTSNLTKGTEDSLQGSVILNDKRVVRITSERFLDGSDFAHIKVYAAEEQ